MSGNIIGFGWEIRKLEFWKLSILDLICCPDLDIPHQSSKVNLKQYKYNQNILMDLVMYNLFDAHIVYIKVNLKYIIFEST